MNTTTTTPQTTTNRVNNKIEDFGQKIGGARKDWFANMREAAQKFAEVGAVDLIAAPLSKVVALPNLEKMTEAGALTADRARAALTIWRSIDARPAGSYRVKYWAEKTAPRLARIGALLNGAEITENERAAVDFLILTAANWPAESFTFGRVKTGRTWGGSCLYAAASNRYIAKSENAADIVAAIRKQTEKDAQKRAEGVRLVICFNRAGEYFVTPEHKTEIILFKGSRAECYDQRDNHADELRARYAEIKTFPELRRDWNRPRVGNDWRNGEDITPETFGAALPFRGVEFGNWVTQAERASLLNSAFDGFHDLAQMLGVSVERVTLGGSLAFAFASRGISRAMAHYEPGRKVINLTKKNGAGCMAHEWFHACDNWAANLGGLHSSAMATERDTQTDAGRCALAISRAIESTEFFTRSRNLARFTSPYWVEPCELAARGFEGVCAYLLNRSGVCSDFLVNCLNMDEFTKADSLHRSDVYPYPSEAEAAALAPYYLNFFRALFGEGAELTADQWADINAQQAKAEAERAEAEAKRAEIARKCREEAEAKAKAEREARDQKRAELLAKHCAEVPAMKARAEADGVQNVAALANCSGVVVAGLLGGYIVAYWTEYADADKCAVLSFKHNGRLRKGARVHRYDIESNEHNAAEYFANISKADEMAGYYVGAPALKDLTAWGQGTATFADLLSKAKEAQRKADEHKAKAETAPRYESAEKSEGAEVLAEADGVQLIATEKGAQFTGNTYAHKDEIKAFGARWFGKAKAWTIKAEQIAEGVALVEGWQTEPTPTEGENVDAVATPAEDANEGAHDEPTAESADPFEGAPSHVRELVDEIKAKPQEGEHDTKRAELLALMAEQWQEKPEYFKKAGACQIINANERETAEGIACDIVAIVAAYQHDHGAPANYIKACDLRTWFILNPEPTAESADTLQNAEDITTEPQSEPTATADAEPVAEGEGVNVWQYTSNEGEQLHEIRRTPSGFFSITWNICEENGGGVFDYTKHKTHADALATLQAFRPGVKPYDPTAPTEGGKAESVAESAPRYEVGEKLSLCRCCGGYYLKGNRETWQGVAERFNMTWGGAVGAWFVRDEIAADVLEFVAVDAQTIGEEWTACEINAEKLAEVHSVEVCEGCAVTFSQSGAVVTFDEQEAQKVGDLLSEGESNAHPIRKGDRIKWRMFSHSGKELDGARYEVAGIHHNPHRATLVIELWEIDGNGKADRFRQVYHDLYTFATSWMCNDWTPSPDPTEPTEGGKAEGIESPRYETAEKSAEAIQTGTEGEHVAINKDVRDLVQVLDGVRYSVAESERLMLYNSNAALYRAKNGVYFFYCWERGKEWLKICTPEALEVCTRYGLDDPRYKAA